MLLLWYFSATRYYYAEVDRPAEIRKSFFYHEFLMVGEKLYFPVKRVTDLYPFLGICRQYFTWDEEKLLRFGQTLPEYQKYMSDEREFLRKWGN